MTSSLQPLLVYEQVREKLRRRVTESWKPGERLPPIAELARQLGTGQVNTGRAVRVLVDEGLLISRPRLGTYRTHQADAAPSRGPDLSAASVLAGKKVALLRTSTVEPFMDAAIAGAADALRRERAEVNEHRYRVQHLNSLLQTLPVMDALVLFNPLSVEMVQPRGGEPVVIVRTGSELPVASRVGADLVTIDSEQGGFLAGEWMKRCGVSDVCFVGRGKPSDPSTFDMTSLLRLTGFEQGLGAEVQAEHQLKAPFYNPDAGGLAMAQYLKFESRPRGVFCASDDLAVGFVCAALSHGLVAGQDYHIIGFDGQVRGQQLMHGPLSTVEVPAEAMGRAAARLLVQRLAQPHEPTRRVSLSCGFRSGRTAPLPLATHESASSAHTHESQE